MFGLSASGEWALRQVRDKGHVVGIFPATVGVLVRDGWISLGDGRTAVLLPKATAALKLLDRAEREEQG